MGIIGGLTIEFSYWGMFHVFLEFFFLGYIYSIGFNTAAMSKKFISKDLGSVGKGRLVLNSSSIHQEKFFGVASLHMLPINKWYINYRLIIT